LSNHVPISVALSAFFASYIAQKLSSDSLNFFIFHWLGTAVMHFLYCTWLYVKLWHCGRLVIVLLYISTGCKRTALHEAVEKQDVARVKELLTRLDLVEINQ